MEAVGDLVGLMGKLNLAPPASVLEVLERALLLTGKAKADLCDARYVCGGLGYSRRWHIYICRRNWVYSLLVKAGTHWSDAEGARHGPNEGGHTFCARLPKYGISRRLQPKSTQHENVLALKRKTLRKREKTKKLCFVPF